MNNLSWFLYFADVSYTIKNILGLTVVAMLLLLSAFNTIGRDHYLTSDEFKESLPQRNKVWISIISIFCLILIVTPSRQTLYMIAASEMGQSMVQSEEGKTIYNDIRNVLKSYAQEDDE